MHAYTSCPSLLRLMVQKAWGPDSKDSPESAQCDGCILNDYFDGTECTKDIGENNIKPIFQRDAKTFAFGPCVGFDPQRKILRWLYQHVGI